MVVAVAVGVVHSFVVVAFVVIEFDAVVAVVVAVLVSVFPA